jgi:hypothetical protein
MTAAEVDLLWRTDPTPYQQRIQALLGDRDPLEVLSQTPQRLAQIVAANSVERLRSRPAPGKWTPNEILGHLADTEWAHGWRMRTVLGGRQAVIVGFDQEGWVQAQGHDERDPREHLLSFQALREVNLRLLRRLGPEDLARVGEHHARGPESLDVLVRIMAGHDLWHLEQIARYLA